MKFNIIAVLFTAVITRHGRT